VGAERVVGLDRLSRRSNRGPSERYPPRVLKALGCRPLARGSLPRDFCKGEHDGQIRLNSTKQGQEGDARAQARYVEERPIREEGHEPQAGDRHRIVRGETRRREGAEEAFFVGIAKILVAKDLIEDFVEKVSRAQIVIEKVSRAEIGLAEIGLAVVVIATLRVFPPFVIEEILEPPESRPRESAALREGIASGSPSKPSKTAAHHNAAAIRPRFVASFPEIDLFASRSRPFGTRFHIALK